MVDIKSLVHQIGVVIKSLQHQIGLVIKSINNQKDLGDADTTGDHLEGTLESKRAENRATNH